MLKKLLGIFQKQGLASGSDDPDVDERGKVERASRVRLMPLHDVYFRPLGETGEPVVVANLSSTGMGLVRETGRFWPQPEAMVQGELVLPRKTFKVQIKVVRNTPSIVGCAFLSTPTELFDAIQEYFKVELNALQLSEVKQEILKEETDGTPKLYRSAKNCELFIVEAEGQIVRFQLSFLGHFFEGARGQPLKYGFIHGDDKEKPKYKGSSLVRFTSNVPTDVLEAATKFILNVEGLSKNYRETIERALRS